MSFEPIKFFVRGIAKPAGSKTGFALKKNGQYTGRVAITDASKGSKDWKRTVAWSAKALFQGAPLSCPLAVRFEIFVSRPKSHYGTGRNAMRLREDAPMLPAVVPDVLKLSRGIEDALTGIVWDDDALIVDELISKRYGDTPGVMISVYPATNPNNCIEVLQQQFNL